MPGRGILSHCLRYKNSSHSGYLQITSKLSLGIQSKQAKVPLLEHWSHDRHRDPTCFRSRAITSLKATGTLSSSSNPPRCRGQLRAGLKSSCHHHSPKPAVSMLRNCGTQSHTQILSSCCCTSMFYTSACQHPSLPDTNALLAEL